MIHSLVDPQHTGIMIALMPRPEDARRLALEGGVAVDNLHVTLFYFGDASAMPLDRRTWLVEDVRVAASRFTPLRGKTFGAGIFNPTGDEPALVLNVGGEALEEFRLALDGMLWPSRDQHRPWAAHMTLAQPVAGVELPSPEALAARMGPVVFDRVRVAFAGQAVDIPLVESMAVVAARTARAIFEATRAGASITASRGVLPATKPGLAFTASRSSKPTVKVDGDVLTFPVVPFVQGVRRAANAPHPELYLTKEFEPALESALQMPVVFQHPHRAEVGYVSIHDPGPFDPFTGVIVGMLTAAKFADDRMVAEVAVWRSKFAQGGPEAEAVVMALETGQQQIEVSIGHFANVVPIGGFFDGEAYYGVHTDVLFDHLALLPVGTPGACTWEAGCGADRS